MTRAPTAEELMMFVDGELEPSRAAEVRTFLESDDQARSTVAGLRLAGNLLAVGALDAATVRGDVVGEVMRRIENEPRGRAVVRRLHAGKLALVAVGAVMAVAAALVLWMRATVSVPGDIGSIGSYMGAEDPSDLDRTAQVDAIDFGTRTGTIFYVPSGVESTTAVVWLMDDEENAATGESL
jgi:anti-sigma factor RsiW